ncbi:hypothetical protein JCM18899A_06420 [Nocardioides sp. AN3]
MGSPGPPQGRSDRTAAQVTRMGHVIEDRPSVGARTYPDRMCRNIRPLHNFEPPATEDEVTAAALQFVRKVAGTTKPSLANQAAFDRAVAEIAHATRHLLDDLVTTAPPKDRDVEAAKRRARAEARYAG